MQQTKMNYWAFPMLKTPPEDMRPIDSINKVLDFNGVTMPEIMQKCRKREIVDVRRICVGILKYEYNWTLKKIGNLFSQDHTTVIHALDKLKELSQTDANTRQQIERFCPQALTREKLF